MNGIQPIGFYRDGRPVWPMAGGDATALPEGEDPTGLMLGFPDIQSLRGLEAYREDVARIDERTRAIDAQANGRPMTAEQRDEFAQLAERRTADTRAIEELEAREAYMLRLAASDDQDESRSGGAMPALTEPGSSATRTAPMLQRNRLPDDIYEVWQYQARARTEADYRSLLVDGARRAIERAVFPHPDIDQDKVRSHLTGLLGRIDDPGILARHVLGTGGPKYGEAFGHALSTMDDRPVRAMSLGTTTAGAFAVPFQLDPTVILVSDGALNPLRQLARVEQITGRQWQGVTSTGITVSRSGEATPATDGSPDLAQPAVGTSRVTGFVPFSVEIESAWSALQTQVALMLADAKDVEEASSFITGDGTGTAPNGLVATLAASSVVFTGGVSFGVEDVYAVKNALPQRFRARAQWLAEGSIYDLVRQFDTAGGSNLWVQLQGGIPPELIGYPVNEISSMDSAIADQADIALIGDFRNFLIVDRIGMSIELIPHLFRQETAGAGVGMPTGQRGIYAHWHNGSEILADNAFRLLRVGSS